jgi:diadenosine tetraphosphatase ApaH/serine/threonine PP2A family protein phosphatase
LNPGIMKVGKGRMLLNPGSVGQPRDGDPRLSYGIYDDQKNTFEIVRLEYNNQKAAAKIREAGLPGFLADRLL